MPRFTDKTVTGAAGALGAGMVRRFASEDARVVVGARRREQALADRDADLRPRAVTYGRSLVVTRLPGASLLRTAHHQPQPAAPSG
ncbi:hypothetical protein SAMN05446589_0175 [Streptomyces sp. OV198]|jgi:NAD(P)-dependent dehydrogenase (short-subunit alcohol dehydrogenase family)|nr:hypothetical protein SAMN05446589_0175 [Streptomyces sp. OV198]